MLRGTRLVIFVLVLLTLALTLTTFLNDAYNPFYDAQMNRLNVPELDSRPVPANLGSSNKFAENEVIMGKLGNATARAELGRATWHLVHTMAARFPEYPTEQQQQSLLQFFHLLSSLYPCGDCAEEFQRLLKQNPPQVSSREAASQWACGIHNLVNKRLKKPQFDCSTVADHWKCGCADE